MSKKWRNISMRLYHGSNVDIDTIDLEKDHHQIATYLTNYALSELVKYVMEDSGCTIEDAMERVYNSQLLPALQDEEGELYVQSPAYLYELMNKL
jgi:hypothetical protein